MNKDEQDINEFLSEHASAGTAHMMDGAGHWLITRLAYQQILDDLDEKKFDQLAEEAFSLFILSSIQTYHTWATELLAADLRYVQGIILDELIGDLRGRWLEWMVDLKLDFVDNLS